MSSGPTTPSSMSRAVAAAAAALVCAVLMGVTWNRHGPTYAAMDPDGEYHLVVSRAWDTTAIPRTLPQVQGLGWDRAFAEKEFLFHAVTGFAHRAGGDDAVRACAPLLGVATVALLAFGAASLGGPVAGVVGVTGAVLFNSDVVVRLLVLRPHLLSMLLFCALVLAVLRGSRAGAAVSGALFALAYHGVQVPLAFLAIVGVYALRGGFNHARVAVAGVLGVVLGMLLNPYFPANVQMGWLHLGLALQEGLGTSVDIGMDQVPGRTDAFLAAWAFSLFAIVVAAWVLHGAHDTPRHDVTTSRVELLGAAALCFLVLTMKNPRAGEYLAPLVALLVGALVAARRGTALVMGVVMLGTGLPAWIGFMGRDLPAGPTQDAVNSRAAARAIPADAPGGLVFNCEWHRGPYIAEARSDLAVVDVLEPAMLKHANPALDEFRAALLAGRVPDPVPYLRDILQARYVFCLNPAVVSLLDTDPSAVRIHPRGEAPARTPRVYVLENDPGALVHAFLVSPEPPDSARPSAMLVQELGPNTRRPLPDARSVVGNAKCARAVLRDEDVQLHEGATLLGLGGRVVRAWVDGKPWWSATGGGTAPRVVNVLVPLPAPLRGTERIEVLACERAPGEPVEVGVSLWKQDVLTALCAHRGWSDNAETDSAYRGTWRSTCIAPVAPRVSSTSAD